MYRPIAVGLLSTLALPVLADDGSLTEKAGSWIDRNPRQWIHGLNEAGLYPSLSSFAEGAGSGPGLAYFAPEVAGTRLDLYAMGARSFGGDSILDLRIGQVPHIDGTAPTPRQNLEGLAPSLVDGSNSRRFFAYGEVVRQTLAGEQLFTAAGDGTPFVYHAESYSLIAGYRVAPHVVASLRSGRLETDAELDVAADSPLAVFNGPVSATRTLGFWQTTASVAYEGRDRPRDPHRGAFVEASAARYEQGGPMSFDRVSLDSRGYVPISERQVLAVRGFVNVDSSVAGGYVPFFLERSLGGAQSLRSYAPFRFRGPRIAAVSAEYRVNVHGPFELAAFYDGGKVWGGPVDMGTGGFASSYGMGLRIKSKSNVLARIDVAHGAEGTRANFAFGRCF
jgi:hypothetical protein